MCTTSRPGVFIGTDVAVDRENLRQQLRAQYLG